MIDTPDVYSVWHVQMKEITSSFLTNSVSNVHTDKQYPGFLKNVVFKKICISDTENSICEDKRPKCGGKYLFFINIPMCEGRVLINDSDIHIIKIATFASNSTSSTETRSDHIK